MKVDGVGKIIEGVNALEAALNSNRVKKVIVLDTELNKSNKFNFLIEDIKKQNIEIEIVKDNKILYFKLKNGRNLDRKTLNLIRNKEISAIIN